jgi:hypothetical protein
MSDGPSLTFQWDKIQWLALKGVPWTSPDVLDFVLRVEQIAQEGKRQAEAKLAEMDARKLGPYENIGVPPRSKLRLVQKE